MNPTPSAVSLPVTATDLTSTDPARIGPYQPLKRLGAGGMGVVYAARTASGELVAVKLIHPEYAADEEFRARFTREVDLLRRVGGACAVPLLDADTGAERPWLVTPLVRGMTLSAYMRKHGALDEQLLIGLAAGVAEALAQIHEAGIAHRDLKPANIVLSPEGPRVLDFGVARAVDQTALTRTGSVMGSPGWISPDHYQGKPASTADDIFAWGALVTYAATGRPPFGSGDPAAIAHRVISGEPDTEGFTGPLADLARQALQKEGAQRPTALQLVSEMVSVTHPGRSFAPVASAEAAGSVMGALVDNNWHGVQTAPEREFAVKTAGGAGAGRALALAGAVLGALLLIAGLGIGGVALANNWDSLPVAAWFSGGEDDEGGDTAKESSDEEQRRPGPVGKEPTEEASPSDEPSEEAGGEDDEDDAGDEGEEDGGSTTTMATVGAGVSASGSRPAGDHVVAFQPAGGSGQYAVVDGATVVCAWSFCQEEGGGVADGAAGTVSSSPGALTGYVNSGSRTVSAEVTYTESGGTVTITRLVEHHKTSGSGTPPW
ncbi:serine/threonine-protein kinase [Nocardiopsis sp. L17-MgMaSL7]|uniref:serine/threonine-protein kinase n=1 Tax=Nocardiopsis sp. L17-MgMaSL7 TaxID=1938893 RepID=UPI000D71B2FF|nr:serine/threonine-protein kinase [Nocardiopsis sp. L17-MgMaSL7]PWV45730.1 serine/threonine protein kinase [Nocardiopsis sp. L17-MgMaSL7]